MKKRIYTLLFILIIALMCGICACGKEKKELTPLNDPQNVEVRNQMLVWDKVENASGYFVSVNSREYEAEDNFYDVSFLIDPGSYIIKVIAVGDGENYDDSHWVSYTYIVEESVELGYDEQGFLYRLLEDRTGYELFVGNANLEGELIIPERFGNLPVKQIGDTAFSYNRLPKPFEEMYCTKQTTAIRLPATVERIGYRAFAGMISVKEIVLPDALQELGDLAFYGCKSLERVVFSKGLKEIPQGCFQFCALKELSLPESLEIIGNAAFQCRETPLTVANGKECRSTEQTFTEVKFPDSIKWIGDGAFYGCYKLKNILLPQNLDDVYFGSSVFEYTAWHSAQADGVVYLQNVVYGHKGEMPQDTALYIPATAKYIAGKAFNYQNNLISVFIADEIKFLGEDTFYGCDSLSEVRLPADLTVIPARTFSSCDSLSKIELPDTVTEIGENAFSSCGITEIVLPATLKVLSGTAFNTCKALEKIYYAGSETDWNVLLSANNIQRLPAEVYTYSEEQPQAAGNYWHYANGIPIVW